MVSGAHIEVLQNVRHGPIIIALDGCRIVLGRGMAEKILVE
jgi:Fe2+ transport system protein FeoA